MDVNGLNLAIQDSKSLVDNKPISTVLIEAVVVGVVLLLIVLIVKHFFRTAQTYVLVFSAGAMTHLLFQVTGLNYSYVQGYIQKYSTVSLPNAEGMSLA